MRRHLLTALFVVSTLLSHSAYAQTVVYDQNFESPSAIDVLTTPASSLAFPNACAPAYASGELPGNGAGSMGWNGGAQAYGTTSTPFVQVNTADVICINSTSAIAGNVVTESPSVLGGDYALGFHGGNQVGRPGDPRGSVESIGFVFDPLGFNSLNGRFDVSLMGIPGRAASTFSFEQGIPVNFTVNFYEVPAGIAAGSIALQHATAYASQTLHPEFAGVVQSPISSFTKSVSNRNSALVNRYILDWNEISFNLDLRTVASNSKVMMVLTGLPSGRYMAVDNMLITVQTNLIAVPEGQVIVPPGTTRGFDIRPGTTFVVTPPITLTATSHNPAAGTVIPDSTAQRINFTPAAGFIGSVRVTYQACDSTTPTPVCGTNTVTFIVPAPASTAAIPVGGPAVVVFLSLAMGVALGLRRKKREVR